MRYILLFFFILGRRQMLPRPSFQKLPFRFVPYLRLIRLFLILILIGLIINVLIKGYLIIFLFQLLFEVIFLLAYYRPLLCLDILINVGLGFFYLVGFGCLFCVYYHLHIFIIHELGRIICWDVGNFVITYLLNCFGVFWFYWNVVEWVGFCCLTNYFCLNNHLLTYFILIAVIVW